MRSMMPNSDSMSAPRLSDTDAMKRAASCAEVGLGVAATVRANGLSESVVAMSDILLESGPRRADPPQPVL
jgi:hypothetical protein